jgi:hypothetical protein
LKGEENGVNADFSHDFGELLTPAPPALQAIGLKFFDRFPRLLLDIKRPENDMIRPLGGHPTPHPTSQKQFSSKIIIKLLFATLNDDNGSIKKPFLARQRALLQIV